MLKYILRRILYMIPTVFGVILITFILFNVSGGDPAIMRLGKNATPRALEEYDIQRGFDKPLFFGRWGKTRAFYDSDFKLTPGPWSKLEGLTYRQDLQCIVMPTNSSAVVPVAFIPDPARKYRWEIVYRCSGDGGGDACFIVRGSKGEQRIDLHSAKWRKEIMEFELDPDAALFESTFESKGTELQISSIRLRKRVAHVFDSQLWFYLRQLSRLDFGVSLETNQRISTMIRQGVLPSLSLTVPIFIAGLMVSISMALVCAFFRNTFIDRLLVLVSVVLMSVNYLVWIVFLQYQFGYVKGWFPVWGFESWRHLLLPWIIGVVSGLGASLRFYRTVMLDEMYRDYVRTAFAKGVGRAGVLFRHVLKNAMIPILTSVVLTIPFLFTGSLLLESFFGIPGLGNMALNGINNSDVDVIRALVLVGAILYVIANLITDICYAAVDPRVKLK